MQSKYIRRNEIKKMIKVITIFMIKQNRYVYKGPTSNYNTNEKKEGKKNNDNKQNRYVYKGSISNNNTKEKKEEKNNNDNKQFSYVYKGSISNNNTKKKKKK